MSFSTLYTHTSAERIKATGLNQWFDPVARSEGFVVKLEPNNLVSSNISYQMQLGSVDIVGILCIIHSMRGCSKKAFI